MKKYFIKIQEHLEYYGIAYVWVGILIALICMSGCSHSKYIEREEVRYVDSTIFKTVEDTIYYELVNERYVNIALPNDTSHLESTYSISEAFTDSLGYLHHTLENKDVDLPIIYKYNDVIHTVYRDSIKTVEKPVEIVKVKAKYNWVTWISLSWLLMSLACACAWLFIKTNLINIFKNLF